MFSLDELKRSTITALWFIFLTFPIMVIKVDSIEKTVQWRWMNVVYIAVGAFFLSFVFRYMLKRKEVKSSDEEEQKDKTGQSFLHRWLADPRYRTIVLASLLGFAVVFPHLFSTYQTSIMTTALMYVMLGLGLNIVVGLAGLLDLGYVAFYAVGAYTYSLLNLNFGIPFWFCIPIGIVFGCIAGCIIGYPTLKMRGDYLAIVTMGFGEIIRLMLNNWDNLTAGPNGLYGQAKPALIYPSFGDGGLNWVVFHLKSLESLYFLVLIIAVLTVIGVRRLDRSRIGRAWVAIREDEVAAELSGVPTMWLKLLAYALGASFASVVGGFFAAKLSYTNPNFFIFMESCIVLCIVVLGGVGSIPGVIVAAVILSAVPEIFRDLQNYRMLAFGAAMAAMMVLKPEGLIPASRRKRELHASDQPQHEES